MKKLLKIITHNPLVHGSLQQRLIGTVLLLVGIFVLVQFTILATLGTKGAEIAGIRKEMNDLRLQNEQIRAEIDKAKTLAQIETDIYDNYNISRSDVTKIYASSNDQQPSLGYSQ